ncbi:MAG TPA: hypothetical protein VEJ22_02375 [Nitrospirota bacterium]|nr:hypothetical protein [Nitrospirota bacterium]
MLEQLILVLQHIKLPAFTCLAVELPCSAQTAFSSTDRTLVG